MDRLCRVLLRFSRRKTFLLVLSYLIYTSSRHSGQSIQLFTDCIRSTTEGYVFRGVCLLTGGGGTPSRSRQGGTPPPPSRDGVPPLPPVRPTEGVLAMRRSVCLLRSRRRTFLFISISDQTSINQIRIQSGLFTPV